ncbi:DUF433 domain-containing protein [Lampropedia aestuarii]|uniref:DUF433 domain-containing protein n=1 Tax=Lampropedia aestuarii TaxID=2562762 RepID=A0A4S5BXY9_9BURK|nr:DUF433 domain-containing protein [Lampropedia aestuarii]THJ36171.1 DUF433 domain-containing protein [Lampropedia aestuarii]
MYNGTGIYTLPEASRLIGVPAQKLNRWFFGYGYSKKYGDESVRAFSAPLWEPQLSSEEFSSPVIGFHDLLEARFVDAFVAHGIPLVVVRRCMEHARELYSLEFPFTSGRFKTDGKTIFAEEVERAIKEDALLDLKTKQFAFKAIINNSLYDGIEYAGDIASKWYPEGKRSPIVLNPSRQFGSPIVESTGTPTKILFDSYLAEGQSPAAIQQTARTYEVPIKAVESAVLFEENLKRTRH